MSEAYQSRSMLDSGIIGFNFGCYFGLILQSKAWPWIHLSELIDEAIWKPVVRLLVALLIGVPFLTLALLGPNQIGNVYLLMFFSILLPGFI